MMAKLSQLLLLVAFISAIWLPLLDNLIGLDTAKASTEKRILAPFPEFPGDLFRYPEAFEAFYNDHFGFRNRLIFLNNLVLWKAFGDSASNRVIVGEGNWLFYKGRRVIEYHRGLDPFTFEELEAWRTVLEERRDWLGERGIEYAVFFAANKHSIYPEHLPGTIRPVSEVRRLDQLLAHMVERSDVRLIDVRPALLKAKAEERLYHWTDSHWNDLGAYHAYRAVMERLAGLGEAYRPIARTAYVFSSEETQGRDLALILGLQEVIREVQLRLKPVKPRSIRRVRDGVLASFHDHPSETLKPFATVQRNPGLPKAVFFRDSFFTMLVPFFAPHFSRSVYYWQYEFDPAVIEHEKPDIVIHEILERELMNVAPANPPEIRKR
jgi:hypothetical protein